MSGRSREPEPLRRRQRTLQRPRPLAQPRDPVAEAERAPEVALLDRLEPGVAQQAAQRGVGDQVGVRGQVAPPARAGEPRGARGRVGRDDQRHPARRQQAARCAPARRPGRRGARARRRARPPRRCPRPPRASRSRTSRPSERACSRDASASSSPSTASRACAPRRAAARGRSRPRAGARAGRGARSASSSRCDVRRRPGLLGEVAVVAHLAVEVEQLRAGREVGLLDRAAALAGVEVGVAG